MSSNRLANITVHLLMIFFFGMCLYVCLDGIGFHAQERSMISRQKADLRSIQTALDQYYTEHQQFPPMRPLQPKEKSTTPEHLRTIQFTALTTPVTYLQTANGIIQSKFPTAYYTPTKPNFLPIRKCYLIFQEGIDGDFDIQDPEQILAISNKEEAESRLAPFSYDPTNGAKSNGDVWRLHYK